MGVLVPSEIVPKAVNVATPVDRLSVHVPSPIITTSSLGSHSSVAGSMRQVLEASSDTPDASGVSPVMLLNVAVPPGITVCVSGNADGGGGGVTVGVIVAESILPSVSATWYATGV